MTSSLVITGARLVLADRIVRGALHIVGDRIVDVVPAAEARATADVPVGATTIDFADHLIFPGLINAHDHLAINCVPPLRRPGVFPNSYAWAEKFGRHFQDSRVAAVLAIPEATRFRHGGLKNLLAGATTVAHHDPWHAVLDAPDFPVAVLRRFGWCHSLGQAPPETATPPVGGERNRRDGWAARLARSATDGKWGRLVARAARTTRLAPPRVASFGPPVERSFRETPTGAPWIIHLGEGTDAVARDELRQLGERGCLAGNTVLVHGVALDDADVERVIACGASVVWCPSSNLSLLGATLDPRRLAAAGRLALGTDSRVSGARDLLDELRVAAAASALPPRTLVDLVTAGAGRVLGSTDVGHLAPGQRADLLVARDAGDDPYAQLLRLTRADIRAVVRGGAVAIGDADPQLAGWFQMNGRVPRSVVLDGRPKLIDAASAPPEVIALEPGLEPAG